MNVLATYESYLAQIRPCLPISTNVDFLLMLLNLKTGIRTQCTDTKQFQYLQNWCLTKGLQVHLDHENYLYIAYTTEDVEQLVEADHSRHPHECHFGRLLGYPLCCCEKIASVGEANIDNYEQALCNQPFKALFSLINPQYYSQGMSFISHVPCNRACSASLAIAQQVAHFVLSNYQSTALTPWRNVLSKIYQENLSCLYNH